MPARASPRPSLDFSGALAAEGGGCIGPVVGAAKGAVPVPGGGKDDEGGCGVETRCWLAEGWTGAPVVGGSRGGGGGAIIVGNCAGAGGGGVDFSGGCGAGMCGAGVCVSGNGCESLVVCGLPPVELFDWRSALVEGGGAASVAFKSG